MKDPLIFKWLGVAGVELEFNRQRLMIDPYVSRFPMHRILSRLEPDYDLIAQKLNHPDAILVTHSHWDHLFDVAVLARASGCMVYGSANTCQLLSIQGVKDSLIIQVTAGDRFTIAFFKIEALPSSHLKTPLDPWLNAPLSHDLRPPLRPIDFHKDTVMAYRITVEGHTLLHGWAETTAEIFMMAPYLTNHTAFFNCLTRGNHQVFIPIHWDDFMRPLSQPIRPMFEPLGPEFPWLHRVNLASLAQKIKARLPGLQVFVPELLTPYPIETIIHST